MGDWKSNAYMQYIDLTLECRLSNVVKFIDQVDKVVEDYEWLNDNAKVLF